jgi:HEAT repeat protein
MAECSPAARSFDLSEAVAKLNHSDENVRLTALGQILDANTGAQALDAVAAGLSDASQRVRCAAMVVLGQAGARAAARLADALDSKQPAIIRMLAGCTAASLGPEAAPALDALVACLKASEQEVRNCAALALGKIGAPAVASLRKLLLNSPAADQISAANALGYVGSSAGEALNDLKQIVRDESSAPLRVACAAAVLKISGEPKGGLPLLLAALESGAEATRVEVLERLGECGPIAWEAAAAVARNLLDKAPKIRALAVLTLARVGCNRAENLSMLKPLLADTDALVRLNTVIALSTCGADMQETMVLLRSAQQDPDPRVSASASAALERVRGRND